MNNLLFAALTFTVLAGHASSRWSARRFSGVRISVGEPYFNRMALPLGVAILFLMGVGPSLPWGRASPDDAPSPVLHPGGGGGRGGHRLCRRGAARERCTLLTFGLAAFVAVVTLREMTPAGAGPDAGAG